MKFSVIKRKGRICLKVLINRLVLQVFKSMIKLTERVKFKNEVEIVINPFCDGEVKGVPPLLGTFYDGFLWSHSLELLHRNKIENLSGETNPHTLKRTV